MTFPNNVLIYNASIVGYLAGHIRGRRLTQVNTGTPPSIGVPSPSYASLASEATQWAEALDATIAPDISPNGVPTGTQYISVVTGGVGVAIAPTSVASPPPPTGGQITQAQIAKVRLIEMLSLAAFETRYYAQPEPLTDAEFASLASTVSGSYLGTSGSGIVLADIASTPVIGLTNNNLIGQAVFDGFIGGLLLLNQGSAQAVPITALAYSAAAVLAFEVDALVPFDASITVSTGDHDALTPGVISTANAGTESLQIGKTRLMLSIVLAVMETRSTFSLSQFGTGVGGIGSVDLAAIGAWAEEVAPAIAAVYTACVGNSNAGAFTPGSPGIVGSAATAPPVPTPMGSGPDELWNVGLFNEAYCGFIAANLSGRPITATSSADPFYVALAMAAQVFAKQTDLAVAAADTTGSDVPTGTQFITAGGDFGANLAPPATGPIQQGILGKTGVMWAICRGVQHGRPLIGNLLDTTAATYTTVTASIVSLYLEIATILQVHGPT
jgi:hypothetical protein